MNGLHLLREAGYDALHTATKRSQAHFVQKPTGSGHVVSHMFPGFVIPNDCDLFLRKYDVSIFDSFATCHKKADSLLMKSLMSSSDADVLGFSTTYALGSSPALSSGTPITAASATAGCDKSSASNSAGATWVKRKQILASFRMWKHEIIAQHAPVWGGGREGCNESGVTSTGHFENSQRTGRSSTKVRFISRLVAGDILRVSCAAL